MPREQYSDVPRLVVGDRVKDWRGNVGFVRQGEYGLYVFIVSGPARESGRKPWGRASDFQPLIDWDGGTVETYCDSCGRTFKANAVRLESGSSAPREIYCRTHQAKQVEADRARAHHSTDRWITPTSAPYGQIDEDAARRQRELDQKGIPF